ncbi:E3 ubiquitin-protein ligase TRIM39-like [Triplophysa rosa]|uniref:E3 ubiquitin-protein ligase TRIM39-like n=1 Tax=Triplophysa rosa TaxID=992332 RepID=UPI002545F5C7|nr:E3 ubiquitin-protein ligase TRIM39-like [Triplophysa rosa]
MVVLKGVEEKMAECLPAPPKTGRKHRRKCIDLPQFMAYCEAPDMREHLQCSVCLDVFNDPVTTPCGHNFCKTCLTACWEHSQEYRCPYCKGTFIQRPDLKFNVALKAIVQLFEKNPEGLSTAGEPLSDELQCSICLDVLDNPVTTPCGHSFCKTCLTACWEHSQVYRCPYCKGTFIQRPDLKFNVALKVIVQLFEKNPEGLSTAGEPLSDELQCSICLDVLDNPVTTPCGHSFCKTCLKKCWDISQNCTCPVCIETFNKRPDLKCNTGLKAIVEVFEKNSGSGGYIIRCDVCKHRKTIRSCLDCCGTFCDIHLEPHFSIPVLKKHKLINPVENLQDYICQKHERPLEMFCKDDQTYLCLLCARDHMPHKTVIEQKTGERKNQLRSTQDKLQKMIQSRTKKIQEIRHSLETRKRNTKKEIADCVELFTSVIHSIERCQSELLDLMDQKQKAAEDHAEDLMKELEQEITELKRRDTELEQLSHTENHLYLQQIYPSLCSPLNSRNWTQISFNTHQSMKTLWKALAQLQETLNEKLSETVLKGMQQYAVDITLDPETAHPELILSPDGKQVRHENIKLNLPDNPQRFDDCLSILGKERFSTGRFYYEVHVTGKTKWNLGVVRESINRKGDVIMSPENGYWVLCLRDGGDYWVVAHPSVFLSLRVKPQKVGVFVDYEEGLVSFYDVESRSHIYLYTGQSFLDKILPYFCPCNNDEGTNFPPLIIYPIRHTK